MIDLKNNVLASLTVDDYIWFEDERHKYTIQTRCSDWIICTKPFNAQNTVLYTVINTYSLKRGVDNYSGLGYETREECEEALKLFDEGSANFSRRSPPVPLRIKKILLH